MLERSLHEQVMITLGLEERPGAVESPWNIALAQNSETPTPLPHDTQIVNIFDQLGQGCTLLILGEPGSGKTTTLLQLTRDLLRRAEQDVDQLIPVLFNLSSWQGGKQGIVSWLVDELNTKYQVPRPIGEQWVKKQQLLLLLDGLDEVGQDKRNACVVALNTFQQAHNTSLVVCCRIKDYEALTHRLQGHTAIYVTLLTPTQIQAYLDRLTTDLTGLKQLLTTDPALQELARSPLMLNLMVLAYSGIDTADLPQTAQIEDPRRQLFQTYVQRMLHRRMSASPYRMEQIARYLSWLARQLSQQSQTIFLIERLNYRWLSTPRQQSAYTLLSSILVSLVMGLTIITSFGLTHPNWPWLGFLFWISYSLVNSLAVAAFFALDQMESSSQQKKLSRWVESIWTGILSGLMFGFIAGLEGTTELGVITGSITALIVTALDWFQGGIIGLSYLQPVETLKWSHSSLKRDFLFYILGSAPIGFFLGAVGLFGSNVVQGISLAMVGGFLFSLLSGMRSGTEVETRTLPNQGIWYSVKMASATTIFLIIILSLALTVLESYIQVSPGWVLFYSLFVGLFMGGSACVAHLCVRLVLFYSGWIPWNYARFLDWASDRLFLQKVGGGYLFIHRLLMEYFAQLDLPS